MYSNRFPKMSNVNDSGLSTCTSWIKMESNGPRPNMTGFAHDISNMASSTVLLRKGMTSWRLAMTAKACRSLRRLQCLTSLAMWPRCVKKNFTIAKDVLKLWRRKIKNHLASCLLRIGVVWKKSLKICNPHLQWGRCLPNSNDEGFRWSPPILPRFTPYYFYSGIEQRVPRWSFSQSSSTHVWQKCVWQSHLLTDQTGCPVLLENQALPYW